MTSLGAALLVGAGGALGSVARWLLGGWVHAALPAAAFPVGTLAVNVAGSLAIGALGGFGEARGAFGPELRAFLFVGVLGGFTTYSSFAYETLVLARDADWARAAVNVLAQVMLGLGACWLGYALTRG
jgi:fluoride exporter